MKKLAILTLVLSLFVLGGIFDNSAQAATFKNNVISLKYPDDWQIPENKQNTAFIAVSSKTVENFNANMNVVVSASDPTFESLSIETFKQEYKTGLERSGIKNVQFIKAEKTVWDNAPGMYIEYTAVYSNIPIRYVQTFRDNGQNLIILTFVSSQGEWKTFGGQVSTIIDSVVFN